jgi:hydroxyacylglutathione hydrolase
MFFRQYQLGCLSLFSYLIGDETTGNAVVVDPQRDIDQYLHDAEAKGMRIERVIETHFHADFVSGHLELAAATGAAISYGDVATADFKIDGLAHGQRLPLGDSVELEIRHTPGHTPESISIVVRQRDEPWGVLTGDTLFVGDVGRPDLLASAGWSKEDLARQLYRSLHDQLLTLPDGCRVFPAHGAGSACGKHMSAAIESTIGEQRRMNYALRPMTEDAFVDVVTEGQSVAPLYFSYAADANRHVHVLLDDHEAPVELDVDGVVVAQESGAIVLDARAPEEFASGHLRGSVNVGMDGRFAEYAGDVMRAGQPIVLITDPGRETEARVRLARIGFDTVIGCLPDIDAVLARAPERAGSATRIPAADLALWVHESPSLQIVDVRNPGETAEGVIVGATELPLPRLLDGLETLDRNAPTVVYCAGGYRSSIGASLLRAHGFTTVADVLGGYGAWVAQRLDVDPG